MQRKWGVAVSVAGGRLMDAIVTDTKATAAECIRHLREQRVGVADFIPLSGIKNQDVVDRYRSLGKGYRLAVDVVEVSEYASNTDWQSWRRLPVRHSSPMQADAVVAEGHIRPICLSYSTFTWCSAKTRSGRHSCMLWARRPSSATRSRGRGTFASRGTSRSVSHQTNVQAQMYDLSNLTTGLACKTGEGGDGERRCDRQGRYHDGRPAGGGRRQEGWRRHHGQVGRQGCSGHQEQVRWLDSIYSVHIADDGSDLEGGWCGCRLEALESELKELTRSRLKQEVTDKATLLNTLRAKIKSAQESIRFCEKKAVELKGRSS